jgi:RND family efflux transporter MFP subunit
MNARLRRTAIAAALIASLLATGCKKGGSGPGGPGGNNKGSAVAAKMMDLPAQVIATGTITPRVGAQVKVGPRLSGRLDHLGVKIGDRVKKGQILAVLEQKDLQANVARAEATLNDAQASARYAEANYERVKELLPKGYVAKDAVDAAQKAKESARAQVKNAQANLDYVKIQLSYATVTAPIDGIVGSVSTQEGETVASSMSAPTFVTIIDLSRLEVDAYVDEVDIGGVKAGQKATFTVDAFPDKTFHGVVEAIYPQAVVQDNVVNYDVIIGIDGYRDNAAEPPGENPAGEAGQGGQQMGGPGTRPEGSERAGRGKRGGPGGHRNGPPGAEGSRGPMEGAREKPAAPAAPQALLSYEGLLRPQMTASVTINMDSTKGALVIPVKAVKHEGGKAFVMVPGPKGPAQRPVTLGRESGDFVQVKAGLSQGDKVIVAGAGRGSEGP